MKIIVINQKYKAELSAVSKIDIKNKSIFRVKNFKIGENFQSILFGTLLIFYN